VAIETSAVVVNGPRILIATTAHLCRNPRVLKEASTLGSAGFDVIVLTISTTDRFEAADRELLAGAPFRRVALDHRRSQGGWPALRTRGLTWLARQALRRGGLETAVSLGPARPLLAAAQKIEADLTIAHNEIPLWSLPRLTARGRRVAADIEDWYSEDLLDHARAARPLRLLREAERFAVGHATYVTTTSAALAQALAGTYGSRPPAVIRNVFPLQPNPRSDRPIQSPLPKFIWFSQTVGPGRGLEFFLSAWRQMRVRAQVFLLGDVSAGYQAELLDTLPPELRGQLQFLPFVAPSALPDKLAEFDVGLALEPLQPRNKDLTISNKIFQYLNAGLAVVATATAGQREAMARAASCGILTDYNPDALAGELDRLVGEPARLRETQRNARAAAEAEFCWEKESPRLLALVRQSLSS
jgi:glycosyltransferase involved in cell wall biosynthesis